MRNDLKKRVKTSEDKIAANFKKCTPITTNIKESKKLKKESNKKLRIICNLVIIKKKREG